MNKSISLSSKEQRGAALFVSMMILILLTMLALSASQVTSLQEKMASAYWADARAFERSEAALRAEQRALRTAVEQGLCVSDSASLPNWLDAAPAAGETHVLAIRHEAARGSGLESEIVAGSALGALDCAVFKISVADADTVAPSDASAWSVVQSVFVP
jgi:type IV pilus assembly protein PilX